MERVRLLFIFQMVGVQEVLLYIAIDYISHGQTCNLREFLNDTPNEK